MRLPRIRLVKLFHNCGQDIPTTMSDAVLAGAAMRLAWEWWDKIETLDDPEDADLIEEIIRSETIVVGEPDTPRPTVIGTIIELLRRATPQRPINKLQIVAELGRRFPERNIMRMTTTVKNQVPARLVLDRHLDLRQNQLGFWIHNGDDNGNQDRP